MFNAGMSCNVDTGEREPFPSSDIHINISDKPLEFIFLEKRL